MRKLTRKQAEKLLENQFRRWEEHMYIFGLCEELPVELRKDWTRHWEKINKQGYAMMSSYLGYDRTPFQVSFLRLLSAHLFIRDTYK